MTAPPWLAPLGAASISALALACARTQAPDPVPPDASAPSSPAALATDDPLGSLTWLAGTWASDEPVGPRTVEHWLAPEGGTMLAVNRTAMEGRTVFFEYLRIEAHEAGPVLLASPLGRDPPTRFPRVEDGPQWIAFENPGHDYPQRIEYRRDGDRLVMRISGQEDGTPKESSWTLRRIAP